MIPTSNIIVAQDNLTVLPNDPKNCSMTCQRMRKCLYILAASLDLTSQPPFLLYTRVNIKLLIFFMTTSLC